MATTIDGNGIDKVDPDVIVGPVTQIGGIPTGAIVESGSNANGSYTKWADGTLICTKTISGLGPVNVAWGGGFISPTYSFGSFAVPFTSLHNVFGSIIAGTGGALLMTAPPLSSGNFILFRGQSVTWNDLVLSVTAIGRWF